MTQPPQFQQKVLAPKHRAAKPPRWWQFLQRNRLTDAGAKAGLQAEKRISRGVAFWGVPIRLGAGLATMAAALALVRYGGALPLGGQSLAQHLDAIVAQIPGLPGGPEVAAAVDYVKTAGQTAVAAVVASYAGDRYKSVRKARLVQGAHQETERKRKEQRAKGVDVDTDPYEQIHALRGEVGAAYEQIRSWGGQAAAAEQRADALESQLADSKVENRDLKGQVAELLRWKANVDKHLTGHDQAFQDAYGSHLATNQRIDELDGRVPPRPDGGGVGYEPPFPSRPLNAPGLHGPPGPYRPDGGVGAGPPPAPDPAPTDPAPPATAAPASDMLSAEDSSRARALLDRAKQSNAQEVRSRPDPHADQQATGRHRPLPPLPPQQPRGPNRPRH